MINDIKLKEVSRKSNWSAHSKVRASLYSIWAISEFPLASVSKQG